MYFEYKHCLYHIVTEIKHFANIYLNIRRVRRNRRKLVICERLFELFSVFIKAGQIRFYFNLFFFNLALLLFHFFLFLESHIYVSFQNLFLGIQYIIRIEINYFFKLFLLSDFSNVTIIKHIYHLV